MADQASDQPGELSTGRKIRVAAYIIGTVVVLVAVGVLGFQILSP